MYEDWNFDSDQRWRENRLVLIQSDWLEKMAVNTLEKALFERFMKEVWVIEWQSIVHKS